LMYGPDAKTSDIDYSRVEDQREVWEEALQIGYRMGKRITA